MARMTLRAVHVDGERRRWMLCRRIVEENRARHLRVLDPQRAEAAGAADAPAQAVGLVESRADKECIDAAWMYAWSRASLRGRTVSGVTHAIAS